MLVKIEDAINNKLKYKREKKGGKVGGIETG